MRACARVSDFFFHLQPKYVQKEFFTLVIVKFENKVLKWEKMWKSNVWSLDLSQKIIFFNLRDDAIESNFFLVLWKDARSRFLQVGRKLNWKRCLRRKNKLKNNWCIYTKFVPSMVDWLTWKLLSLKTGLDNFQTFIKSFILRILRYGYFTRVVL